MLRVLGEGYDARAGHTVRVGQPGQQINLVARETKASSGREAPGEQQHKADERPRAQLKSLQRLKFSITPCRNGQKFCRAVLRHGRASGRDVTCVKSAKSNIYNGPPLTHSLEAPAGRKVAQAAC